MRKVFKGRNKRAKKSVFLQKDRTKGRQKIMTETAPILQEGREKVTILMTRITFSLSVALFLVHLFVDIPKTILSVSIISTIITINGLLAFVPKIPPMLRLICVGLIMQATAIAGLLFYGLTFLGPFFLFLTAIYALIFGGLRTGLITISINTFLIFFSGYMVVKDIHYPPQSSIPADSITVGNSFLYAFIYLFATSYCVVMVNALVTFVQEAWQREFESAQALEKENAVRQQAQRQLEYEQRVLEKKVTLQTTELRETNVALEQASKRKDSFLAGMSHELRTPLNTILGRTQALNMGIYGKLSDRQLQTVDGIETSGKHLLSLINDILDVSKIAAGEMSVKFEPVNVTAVCDNVLRNIRPLARDKNLQLSVDYSHETNIIQAEERRLKQILINLLSNAVKFTPENKALGIHVSESSKREELIFIVWDKGIGIPQEKQTQLFQPFVQVDSRLSRKYNGTGLGLSLVKQLVDLHNGSIKLESYEGEGSYFIVCLPIKQTLPVEETIATSAEEMKEALDFFQMVGADADTV